MRSVVQTIGTHTATGVDASGRVSVLGDDGKPAGQGASDTRRHIHVTGATAGSSTVKIQGSLDNSNWVDWITGIAADGWYIIEDGPLYIRSNVTTFGSGTVTVKVQKYVEE